MKFVDEARITVKAGHGGKGAVSFIREKFRPRGRPSGGNGGRGGSVIFQVSSHLGSLLDFKYKRHFEAERGENGGTMDCAGKDAEDLVIPVPPGTLIFNDETGDLMCDLSEEGTQIAVAKGGRGGMGNAFFVSSINRGPKHAQPGEEGEQFELRLELKLLADVGLIGLPNAGKSSLIRSITAARPKVADYPFTTLSPQLGVVKGAGGVSVVVADIPGLIEGASHGAGLGHEFLRHVERSSLLLHLIDISPMAAMPADKAYDLINAELSQHHRDLTEKSQWVVLTKTDVADAGEALKWRDYFGQKDLTVFAVSSASHTGLTELVNQMTEWVSKSREEAHAGAPAQ